MRCLFCSKGILTIIAICISFTPLQRVEGANVAKQLSKDISSMLEQVMPSVVVVRTEAVEYYLARDFYRGNIYRIPQRLAGQGSGVIFNEKGYVLTSYHVVQDADNIEVVLDNEEKIPAKIVGADPNTDLAVLKIENSGDHSFNPIEIGNSDELGVGEIVVAVGSPFSLQSSVTMGIVSQKGREVGLLPYEDFIQTDASINPGNSGGPLVNVNGRMVGLNAVIQTPNPQVRGNVGIGFAIPVNLAIRVAESIIDNGVFERPWIGIAPKRDRKDSAKGVLIGRVFQNTPAERAGLKPNDVILEVEGKTIETVSDLQKAVILLDTNTEVEMKLLRNDKEFAVKVSPEPIPQTQSIFGRGGGR